MSRIDGYATAVLYSEDGCSRIRGEWCDGDLLEKGQVWSGPWEPFAAIIMEGDYGKETYRIVYRRAYENRAGDAKGARQTDGGEG